MQTYLFWLITVSLFCVIGERFVPWRKDQKLLRPEILQDVFWLVFNGFFASIVFSFGFRSIHSSLDAIFNFVFHQKPNAVMLLNHLPVWQQVPLFLVIADGIEWCVHNALHRVNWLWKIHRVHHSIKIMDWIGNFRFHWGELFVYQTIKYLPLALLGAHWSTILTVSVISLAIGHLNHSNMRITWGPLRYIFNSSAMHIWHHEKKLRGKAGVNFAVVFSLWDWLFGTAYFPDGTVQPAELGFAGEAKVSRSLLKRFFLPFMNEKK